MCEWLRVRENNFVKSGKLDLTFTKVTDLSPIGTRFFLKSLNCSFTKIDSLASLKPQPNISVFTADSSQISTFKNFLSIKSATKISLKNTPLSKSKHYILTMCILFGDNLKSLDGKLIPKKYRDAASKYPLYIKELINRGWSVEYPAPSDEELADVCLQFGVHSPCEYISTIKSLMMMQEKQIENAINMFS